MRKRRQLLNLVLRLLALAWVGSAAAQDRVSVRADVFFYGAHVPIMLGIVDGISAPGKRVALRAETDILVLISNCPQVNNPCNDFNPTPLRVIVTAGGR